MLPVLRRGISILGRDSLIIDAGGRRTFLKLGAALAGGALFGRGAAEAGTPDAFPPQDAPWSQSLGPGIVDRPYGQPSQFVKDVIRRNVPWLTASNESSVSFSPLQDHDRHHHAERSVLRALPRRPRATSIRSSTG